MRVGKKKKEEGRDMKNEAESIFRGQHIHSLVTDIKEEIIHIYLDAFLTSSVPTSPLSTVFHLPCHCVQ